MTVSVRFEGGNTTAIPRVTLTTGARRNIRRNDTIAVKIAMIQTRVRGRRSQEKGTAIVTRMTGMAKGLERSTMRANPNPARAMMIGGRSIEVLDTNPSVTIMDDMIVMIDTMIMIDEQRIRTTVAISVIAAWRDRPFIKQSPERKSCQDTFAGIFE